MKRKVFCFTLCLLLILSNVLISFASHIERKEVDIGTYAVSYSPKMSHYSTAYWKLYVGEGKEIDITDKDLNGAMNLIGYLKTQDIEMSFPLPDEVQTLYNNGNYIVVSLVQDVIPIENYFDISTLSTTIKDSKIIIKVKPKLPLLGLRTFDDYVADLNVNLPLIDYNYGMNTYEIYKKAARNGTAYGAFYAEKPDEVVIPYIHPSYISNNTGLIYSANDISLASGYRFRSSKNTIGYKTFINGGDVGILFQYSFKINYKTYEDVTVDDIEEGTDDSVPSKWLIHRKL